MTFTQLLYYKHTKKINMKNTPPIFLHKYSFTQKNLLILHETVYFMHENMQLFYLHPKLTAKSEILRGCLHSIIELYPTTKTIYFDSKTAKIINAHKRT